jgi:NAD(P)H-flavin reductase
MADHLLVPELVIVNTLRQITEDTILLDLAFENGERPGGFSYLPGQFMELSIFGVGECPISITSTPTRPDSLEFAIRDVGTVTHALHNTQPGDQLGMRGPFGNGFPAEEFRGRDVYFIAGGIGLAPLRSLVNFMLDRRTDYGEIDIVYGARTPDLLCFSDEYDSWRKAPHTSLHLTVDTEAPGWEGRVGFVPQIVKELSLPPDNRTVVVCGPPIMIKFVLADLALAGYPDHDIITTLELKMKCGVGKCGRCNIGPKYVCRDGPVVRVSEIKALRAEF